MYCKYRSQAQLLRQVIMLYIFKAWLENLKHQKQSEQPMCSWDFLGNREVRVPGNIPDKQHES